MKSYDPKEIEDTATIIADEFHLQYHLQYSG
jgi:hypothetical protein